MPKSVEKRNMTQASSPDGLDARGGAKAGAAAGARQAKPTQMESFEEGMRLLHARQFKPAKEFFEQAMGGSDRTVAHRAGLHARICAQRLDAAAPVIDTPEDHYNYAITLINSRDLASAQGHLKAALAADPSADHVLYALAACQSLGGDLQAAYENLKRAIDLQPRNRLAARQDPDFAGMAGHPAYPRLLYPDRNS